MLFLFGTCQKHESCPCSHHCGLLLAKAKEWTWKKLPRGKADRAKLHYNGGPKIWYSTGHWICKNYVHCLLAFPELQKCDIQSIPHYIPQNAAKTYLGLLHGEKQFLPTAPLQRLYEDDEDADGARDEEHLEREQYADILSDEEEWLAAISAAIDEEKDDDNAEAERDADGRDFGDRDRDQVTQMQIVLF